MKITCKSYSAVVECLNDPLLQCKLACFSSVAQCVEPFLTLYQTDRPVLASDRESMLRKLMKCFVKNTVLTEADTVMKLVAVDIVDVENLKGYSSIDCGFVANKCLKELLTEKKVSERQVLAFKMETRSFLTGIVQKLLVKNPLPTMLQNKTVTNWKTNSQNSWVMPAEDQISRSLTTGKIDSTSFISSVWMAVSSGENCGMLSENFFSSPMDKHPWKEGFL